MDFQIGSDPLPWYWYVLCAPAAMIVFPDKTLAGLGERLGRDFGLRHLLWLEGALLIVMTMSMVLVLHWYPDEAWFLPLVLIMGILLIRGVCWAVLYLLGPDLLGPED